MRISPFLLLVVVNTALAGVLMFNWHDPLRLQWVEPAAVLPALDYTVAVPHRKPVDVSQFRETLERPLFTVLRRPQLAQAEGADATLDADPLKDFRLLGVVASDDRGGVVLNYSGKVQRLRFGEKIAGWTVVGSDGNSVSLSRGASEKRQLKMVLTNVAPAPAAPTTASAAAPAAPSEASLPSAARTRAEDDGARGSRIMDGYRRRVEEERARALAAKNANQAAPRLPASSASGKQP